MIVSEEGKVRAIFFHDVINIAFFAVINTINVVIFMSYTDLSSFSPLSKLESLNSIFTIHALYIILSTYTIFDTILVLLFPYCVQATNPMSIVYHHMATGGLIYLSQIDTKYSWHMSLTLLLEINTLFLTIKRNIPRGTMAYIICDFMFYFTWLCLRVLLLPYLTYLFSSEYHLYSQKHNSYMNILVLAPFLIFALTLLSYYWTYQMWRKMYTKASNSTKSGKEKSN